MSEPSNTDSIEAIADQFDRDADPLAKLEADFAALDVKGIDPFEVFIERSLKPEQPSTNTLDHYDRVIRQWCEFMDGQSRHPACPSEKHVKGFIHQEVDEKGNNPETAKNKLWRLGRIFKYWQHSGYFPHERDYDPFQLARDETHFDIKDRKDPPRIPVEELTEIINEITHIRDRAIVVMQLKLGMRAGEITNIRLPEISIANSALRGYYSELGSHDRLDGRENAIYIPSNDERDGNKSRRPRILPLDDETRRALTAFLLMRPDCGRPWAFLSRRNYIQMQNSDANKIWKDAFHPEYEYDDDESYRSVTSHFGRHYFTTWWRVHEDLPRELVKYLRGDRPGRGDGHDSMDTYLHTYYEDIRELYLERIYKLDV